MKFSQDTTANKRRNMYSCQASSIAQGNTVVPTNKCQSQQMYVGNGSKMPCMFQPIPRTCSHFCRNCFGAETRYQLMVEDALASAPEKTGNNIGQALQYQVATISQASFVWSRKSSAFRLPLPAAVQLPLFSRAPRQLLCSARPSIRPYPCGIEMIKERERCFYGPSLRLAIRKEKLGEANSKPRVHDAYHFHLPVQFHNKISWVHHLVLCRID